MYVFMQCRLIYVCIYAMQINTINFCFFYTDIINNILIFFNVLWEFGMIATYTHIAGKETIIHQSCIYVCTYIHTYVHTYIYSQIVTLYMASC